MVLQILLDFLNDFFYSLIEGEGEGLTLEHFYLGVDGDNLAISYGVPFKNTFFGISRAMKDSPLARFSPGILLLMGELELACEDKMKMLDLGPGDSVYKKHWGYQKINRFDSYYAFTMKGQLYMKAQRVQLAAIKVLKENTITRGMAQDVKKRVQNWKDWGKKS